MTGAASESSAPETTASAEPSASRAGAPPRRHFALVEQLRGAAALLVVYAHLVANFLLSARTNWPPKTLVDRFIEQPLHGELSMGWLAVVLFFFISGFVITHATWSESTPEFAIKRLLRIYPPVIVATLLAAVLAWCGVLVSGLTAAPDAADVVRSASLVNYLVPNSLVLVAVGWTLVIEVIFYLVFGALRPLLSRAPVVVPLATLAICLAGVLLMPDLGPAARIVVWLAFLPVVTMGQIIYLTVVRKVPVWAGGLLMGGAWVVFVFGMERADPAFAVASSGFFANVALAGAVFVVAVLAEGRVKPLPALAVIARRSFSLYLLHVPVGFTVLSALALGAHWPYPAALAVALVATAAATELSYRFVERPASALARRVSRRIRRPRLSPESTRTDPA